MKVLADTSVWSLALRRKERNKTAKKLAELITFNMIVMIGPVRQEILSGISDKAIYNNLMNKLRSFDDLMITTSEYETAADFYNICRKKGIQGSHIVFLICAVSYNNNLLIYTLDQDFQRYGNHLSIRLFDISDI